VADQNVPQQVQVRFGKRERLLESGADPYPAVFERTATAAGLRAKYGDLPPDTSTGEVVSVAGRVMLSRTGGENIRETVMFPFVRPDQSDGS